MKTIVTLDRYGDSRFKSWSKALTGVDCEQSTGYAFHGEGFASFFEASKARIISRPMIS